MQIDGFKKSIRNITIIYHQLTTSQLKALIVFQFPENAEKQSDF